MESVLPHDFYENGTKVWDSNGAGGGRGTSPLHHPATHSSIPFWKHYFWKHYYFSCAQR
jgi:hypothetical protein